MTSHLALQEAADQVNKLPEAYLRACIVGAILTMVDIAERRLLVVHLASAAAQSAELGDRTVSEVLSEWYARHEIEAHLADESL